MCDLSRQEFMSLYQLLNVDTRLIERGESFYNSYLPVVVEDLLQKKIASTHEGAVLVLESNLSELKKNSSASIASTIMTEGGEGGANLSDKPRVAKEKSTAHSAMMIRKSDGAYLYGTTDIAAIYHR
jgi:arginyl-tRNA synthetase